MDSKLLAVFVVVLFFTVTGGANGNIRTHRSKLLEKPLAIFNIFDENKDKVTCAELEKIPCKYLE